MYIYSLLLFERTSELTPILYNILIIEYFVFCSLLLMHNQISRNSLLMRGQRWSHTWDWITFEISRLVSILNLWMMNRESFWLIDRMIITQILSIEAIYRVCTSRTSCTSWYRCDSASCNSTCTCPFNMSRFKCCACLNFRFLLALSTLYHHFLL